MNPAVSCFRMIVRQVDLARPEAPLKITVCGHGLAPVYRLTVGAQTRRQVTDETTGDRRQLTDGTYPNDRPTTGRFQEIPNAGPRCSDTDSSNGVYQQHCSYHDQAMHEISITSGYARETGFRLTCPSDLRFDGEALLG